MDIHELLADIRSDRIKKILLDTDAYNEIDDQYAIAYAMRSKDIFDIQAICAAPFFNSRSSSAADGMIQSYNEIFKIARLADKSYSFPIYKGSESFLEEKNRPIESEAADKIAEIVLSNEEPIYIVALGAITNVASAIIKYPEIVERTAVIWLGGHSLYWQDTAEFNLQEDVKAAQVVFDSGIPLLQIPCRGVCSEFITTIPELEYYLKGKNELCEYLLDSTRSYTNQPFAWSKQIWDVTALAVFTVPSAFDTVVFPRPIITSEMTYSTDMARKPYAYVRRLRRDPIYADLFRKLVR